MKRVQMVRMRKAELTMESEMRIAIGNMFAEAQVRLVIVLAWT